VLKEGHSLNHIPFVGTERDCTILRDFYPDVPYVRVALFGSDRTTPQLPHGPKVWVDAGVDVLGQSQIADAKYQAFISAFSNHALIADPAFQAKPDGSKVRQFVNDAMDACAALRPVWVSVPQLPMTADASRNKINRELAQATRDWATKAQYGGKLVLPVIFTHQSQVNLKTARGPKLALAAKCCELSGAHGVWAVDSSLKDQDGSRTLEQMRFPAIISLHQELLDCLPSDTFVIGGPYWGLNLVLWARGLIRFSAIGMGNQYQYHLPGGRMMPAKSRIALGSLKRCVVASQNLHSWLSASVRTLPRTDPAHAEFTALLGRFPTLLRGSNREQVARVYRQWLDTLDSVAPAGRSLALYQQLSSAYVLGKGLPDLPQDEGTAKRPERVAKQLMLVCL